MLSRCLIFAILHEIHRDQHHKTNTPTQLPVIYNVYWTVFTMTVFIQWLFTFIKNMRITVAQTMNAETKVGTKATNNLLANFPKLKLKMDWRPSIDMDAFTTTYIGLLWPWPVIFDLHNLIRSSVWNRPNEHSLSVLSKLFKPFTRCRGNNIWPDERTNERNSLKICRRWHCRGGGGVEGIKIDSKTVGYLVWLNARSIGTRKRLYIST